MVVHKEPPILENQLDETFIYYVLEFSSLFEKQTTDYQHLFLS